MLPVWVWIVIALLAVAVAASSSGGDDTATDDRNTTDSAATPTDEPITDRPTDDVPTPAPTGGTVDDPWEVGDPDASFESSNFFGDRWEGTVTGLVGDERGILSDDPGDCVAVVGEMIATEVDGFTTLIFGTPDVRLIVDGRLLDSEFGVCDTTDLERSGYGWLLEAAVTKGSSYAFYDEFLVPPGGTIEAVVVGDASSNDASFYAATVTGAIPPVTMHVAAPVPDGLLPVGDPNRSTFTYDDGSGDVWDGYLAGLVEVELSSFTDETGRCLVVVGTLVPTETGGAISNFGSTPDIFLLVDGRANASDLFSCDTSAVEDAGYDWILDAEVTAGTVFAFHEAFLVPEGREVSAIIIGETPLGDVVLFEPTVLDRFPTPDRNPSTRTGRLDVSRAPGVTAALGSSDVPPVGA